VTGRRLASLIAGILLSVATVGGAATAGVLRWRRWKDDQRKIAETRKVIERFALSARTARARGFALPATISRETSGSLALLARTSGEGLSVVEGSSGELGSFG
jgi:hypothetical protein